MKKFMASYKGKSGNRTFGFHDSSEAAKREAEEHAAQNGTLRGQYSVNEGTVILGDLFSYSFGDYHITGIKKGKFIVWEV